jgi:Flp pilus assembly protein TadG
VDLLAPPTTMSRRRAVRRGRAAGERGAVLVEAALVFPVLMLIVMGIIEFGLAMSNLATVGASTRAGSRTAVIYSRQAGYDIQAVAAVEATLTSVNNATPQSLWVYRVDPTSTNGSPVGFPTFANCTTDCQQYTWNGSAWILTGGNGWASTAMNACISPLDQLAVRVRVRHEFISGMFGANITLTDHTVMRLEPQPLSTCA